MTPPAIQPDVAAALERWKQDARLNSADETPPVLAVLRAGDAVADLLQRESTAAARLQEENERLLKYIRDAGDADLLDIRAAQPEAPATVRPDPNWSTDPVLNKVETAVGPSFVFKLPDNGGGQTAPAPELSGDSGRLPPPAANYMETIGKIADSLPTDDDETELTSAYPGAPLVARPITRRGPTPAADACPECHGKGGVGDPEVMDQWYECHLCNGLGRCQPPPAADEDERTIQRCCTCSQQGVRCRGAAGLGDGWYCAETKKAANEALPTDDEIYAKLEDLRRPGAGTWTACAKIMQVIQTLRKRANETTDAERREQVRLINERDAFRAAEKDASERANQLSQALMNTDRNLDEARAALAAEKESHARVIASWKAEESDWHRREEDLVADTRLLKSALARAETLRREAETHAMEARAQRSTVHEIYRAVTGGTGEPGDWNGACPVVEAIKELRARAETAEAAVRTAVGADREACAVEVENADVSPGGEHDSAYWHGVEDATCVCAAAIRARTGGPDV